MIRELKIRVLHWQIQTLLFDYWKLISEKDKIWMATRSVYSEHNGRIKKLDEKIKAKQIKLDKLIINGK